MSELDLTGLVCPMPVLKTKKALARMAPGEELSVLTDDPHALPDLRQFAEQSRHVLLEQSPAPGRPGVTVHVIRRRSDP